MTAPRSMRSSASSVRKSARTARYYRALPVDDSCVRARTSNLPLLICVRVQTFVYMPSGKCTHCYCAACDKTTGLMRGWREEGGKWVQHVVDVQVRWKTARSSSSTRSSAVNIGGNCGGGGGTDGVNPSAPTSRPLVWDLKNVFDYSRGTPDSRLECVRFLVIFR